MDILIKLEFTFSRKKSSLQMLRGKREFLKVSVPSIQPLPSGLASLEEEIQIDF
jgi:hypothetical protein